MGKTGKKKHACAKNSYYQRLTEQIASHIINKAHKFVWGLKHRDTCTRNTWHHIVSYQSTVFTVSEVSKLRLGCVGFLGSAGTPSSVVIWEKHIVSQPVKLLHHQGRTRQKATGKVAKIVGTSFIGIKCKTIKLDDSKWSISEPIFPILGTML